MPAALAAAAVLAFAVAASAGGATLRGDGHAHGAPTTALRDARFDPLTDSFAHARHTKVPCLTCHLSSQQSKLTFEPPRGCQSCHHSEPAQKDCTTCHKRDSLPKVLDHPVVIAAADKPPRERTVAFRHERHAALPCIACHGQPVTMLPVDSARTCQGCHASHHERGRQCSLCHATQSYIFQAHDVQPVDVHVSCDACHKTANIAPLWPTRSFCLVCHDAAVDHHPGHECTVCHMQATPEEYRQRLLAPPKTD